MSQKEITAALILIGNEILSGRTVDKNLNYIAKGLNAVGVRFREARVIPDIESTIIDTVRELSSTYDHVFTTGGIGPTHDDITSSCVAKAFNVELIQNEKAREALENYYSSSDLSDSRLRMSYTPEGATLIPNPISGAPGFTIGNVHVMAGIPNIMQAMFDHLVQTIEHGERLISREVSAYASESAIAKELTAIQEQYPTIEIGSYPFVENNKIGVSLVIRGTDETILSACEQALTSLLEKHN
jgi:molybdenum cofactor synthesis domain-containing protein